MNFNIFEKKYQYLGLHVNMHAIRALQFQTKHGSNIMQAHTNATLPKGLMQNDEFIDRKKLSEFIRSAIASPQYGRFTTDRAIVAIPESKSFVRAMEMQLIEDDKAEMAIMFEAEGYIPMPMDQVYFDWKILGKKEKTMDVLVVASAKVYVDTLSEIVEGAGLKLCGVEVEAHSVRRALVPPTVSETVLIADMDAVKTALIMVENKVVQFTSSVPIAGNVFTERLAKTLGIPPDAAEKLKREVGFANTVEYPNLKASMTSAVEDLAAEIKNILKFHYEHSDSHINQILLTGGGAKLQHLGEVLTPLLESYAPVTITVANPLEHVPNLKHSSLTPYEALSYTTAIGLAMWGMDV